MKKLLLSLLLFVGFNICFSFGSYESLLSGNIQTLYSTNNLSNVNVPKYSLSSSDLGNIYCLSGTILTNRNTNCNGTQQSPNCTLQFIYGKDNGIYQNNDSIIFYINQLKFETDNTFFGCIEYNYGVNEVNQLIIKTISSTNQNVNIDYDLLKFIPDSSGGSSPSDCPSVDTGSILSGYILESSVDQNYCQNNNLCPSSSCDYSGYILESEVTQDYCEVTYNLISPSDCPVSGGSGDIMWSSFWINERQILGGENIYLYLPEYLNWDYTYVDQNLQIDVTNEGDQEYIQGIIDINSYRPTNEEFIQSFVGGLTLLMPYILIVLLIVAIWGLIKKIFK